MTNIACGPPKPRKAVKGGRLVRQEMPVARTLGMMVAAGGVEQGALQDGGRQVGGGAGVLVIGHLVGQDLAAAVEADPEIRGVGVALAGQAHVLVAVQHQLDRPAQGAGGQGGHHRPGRGLVLLAAEGAAQPGDLHLDRAHGQAQHAGGDALHDGGRLGGARQLDPSPSPGRAMAAWVSR